MAAIAAAGIGAAGSLAGGVLGGKGAAKAAKIQAQAQEDAIAEQKAEYGQTQTNEAPFLQAGTSALSGTNGLLAFLGLQGAGPQQSAYDSVQNSPAFSSTIGVGNSAILSNASATGGLRGGNVNNPLVNGSLPNYDQSVLAQLIQQHIGNLGGLVNTGQAAAGGLATAGQANANAISSALTQQGAAQAGGAQAQGAITNSTINSLANQFSNYVKNGGIAGGSASYNTPPGLDLSQSPLAVSPLDTSGLTQVINF